MSKSDRGCLAGMGWTFLPGNKGVHKPSRWCSRASEVAFCALRSAPFEPCPCRENRRAD